MRTLTGTILLPENAPNVKAGKVVIEARDISYADAPSTVIAERRLSNVTLKPNGEINFKLPVPEVESGHTLSLRVHVNLDGSGQAQAGDLLTTTHIPIPNTGNSGPLELSVDVI